MSIYSVCFADVDITVNGTDLALWTVPAGYVDILRAVDGYSLFAGTGSATLKIDANYRIAFPSLGAGKPIEWRGRQVFVAGTVLKLFTNQQPFGLRFSGYRLPA